MRGWALGPLVLGVVGCASTSPAPAFHDVAAAVEQRSGHRVAWDAGTGEDAQVQRAVEGMLSHPLTVDEAVQIALLRNESLLATYEELGVGQADLVQAGLLKNPVFGLALAPSEYDTLQPPIIGSVAMDFLDLFTLPARKKIAATELEAVKMRVGDAVLDLAAGVRSAYFAVLGAAQVVAMRRTILEAADAAAELAKRQNDAGNLNDLDLANEQALDAQVRLDLTRAEADALAAREELTRLMGLWGTQTQWRTPDRLPELPPDEGPLDHLESLAVAQRLDLAARRREVEALARIESFVQSTRWTGTLQAQLEVDPTIGAGHNPLGPGLTMSLPIFDQGQASVARVRALRRQSEHRLNALAVEVRSQVRLARDRVVMARKLADGYRAALVPLRERVVALAQQQYDAMLLGVYQLIAAKQNEVDAYRGYIEAVRDYWVARSDLERAVGGRIGPPPAAAPAPAAEPPAPPPMDHSKMHM
jgi:cobalt-zinc-cadmium efflux system outer membrane protein